MARSDLVESAVRFMPIEGIIASKNSSFPFLGHAYDVQEGERTRGKRWAWDALFGQPLNASGKPQILVGKGLAEPLGCEIPKEVHDLPVAEIVPDNKRLDCFDELFQLTGLTVKSQINAWDSEISGIIDANYRELDNRWLLMPLKDAHAFYDSSQISMIGVLSKDPAHAADFRRWLTTELSRQNVEIEARPWQEHRLTEIYRSSMNQLSILRFLRGRWRQS